MITIAGEVRKVIDSGYTDRSSGKHIPQAIIVIEPHDSPQNYEVYLTTKQLDSGIRKTWESLKGKQASVIVSLYVNHQYKFHKFTAVADAKPLAD